MTRWTVPCCSNNLAVTAMSFRMQKPVPVGIIGCVGADLAAANVMLDPGGVSKLSSTCLRSTTLTFVWECVVSAASCVTGKAVLQSKLCC